MIKRVKKSAKDTTRNAKMALAADRLRAANKKIKSIYDESQKFIISGKAKLAEYQRQTDLAVTEAKEAQRELGELASGVRWNQVTSQFEEC